MTRRLSAPTYWLTVLIVIASNARAAETTPADRRTISASADEVLAIADKARDTGDFATAETVYRALLADPRITVRSEARFRLAMMFASSRRFEDAAILLRQVLDEQPGALRVRLELARVLEILGDETSARRALREAQAGGLPPDVARLVDRYSAALRARKPLGASIEIAVAPDSNINRATRSDTLGTVLGDFELDEDAKQKSGVGLALRGQGYARLPVQKDVNWLGRLSSSADLYRDRRFEDVALGATIGPEVQIDAARLSVEAGGVWRWFGGKNYSQAWTAGLNYVRPIGRRAQFRTTTSVAFVDNHRNPLQDGRTYSASLSYEHALSNRSGFGVSLSADRQALRDPGYSTWGGQVTLFGYRELGPITLVGTLGYGRLAADARVSLFPQVRSDRYHRASLGATFRNLRIGTFAPLIRATFERNNSTTEVYEYRKLRTEFGVTRAF